MIPFMKTCCKHMQEPSGVLFGRRKLLFGDPWERIPIDENTEPRKQTRRSCLRDSSAQSITSIHIPLLRCDSKQSPRKRRLCFPCSIPRFVFRLADSPVSSVSSWAVVLTMAECLPNHENKESLKSLGHTWPYSFEPICHILPATCQTNQRCDLGGPNCRWSSKKA